MNYFPFHIGDYLSATRHLSWDEDAAYRRLLDVYYTIEGPMPSDMRKVFRLVVATTDSQREAVKAVLEEFFTLTDDGWVNDRADREIYAMRDKQQKQREKANKRWQKPVTDDGTASALPKHQQNDATASVLDANGLPPTPTPTPTPTPINVDTPPQSVGVKRPTRKCPDSFVITEKLRAWAIENAPQVNVDKATELFMDHTFKTAISDWDGAWRNWMRRSQEYEQEKAAKAIPKKPTGPKPDNFSSTSYGPGGRL